MSKLRILNDKNEALVGIFEKKTDFDIGREKPRLAIIVHGILGHKDYLFHRALAERLPISSFRFDFRGNGESEGSPGYSNIEEDAQDIDTVATHFENEGYEIYAVIGHSRGALSSFLYATSCEKPLPIMVNLSGRFKMNDNQLNTSRPEIGKALRENGYFDWHVKQRDRTVTVKVTMPEVEKFQNWSNEFVSRMPLSTCVLTCHGLNDTIVPPYNAAMFANKVPNHTLVLMPDADHFYRGKYEEVSKVVVDFFQEHEKDNYKRAISMGQGSGLVIPRWIDIEGVKNFRDIGGWPVNKGNGYIRERTVFRSANLANLTPHSSARLQGLNVMAVFDFRSDFEIKQHGAMKDIPGVTRYAYDLSAELAKTPADIQKNIAVYLQGPEGFAKGYMMILDSGKKLIGDVFRFMAKELSLQDRSSMIIHCTAGKDRTGIFVAILLGLCGVEDEIIAREYELSSIGYFEKKSETEIQQIAQKFGVKVEQLYLLASVSMEGMLIALKQLKEKYGSFEGYVRDTCGVSDEEIKAVRELMIVPIRFEERQLYRGKN